MITSSKNILCLARRGAGGEEGEEGQEGQEGQEGEEGEGRH